MAETLYHGYQISVQGITKRRQVRMIGVPRNVESKTGNEKKTAGQKVIGIWR